MRPLFLTLLLALVAVLALAPAASADRAFTARYATNDFGDVASIGNTLMTCPDAEAACANVRAGIGSGAALNDNNHTMTYVDVDGDPATFDSSSATLAMPAGATVLWAGLYWGGDVSAGTVFTGSPGTAGPAPNAALEGAARITPPGGSPTAVTATQVDTLASNTSRYQAFADVTSLVRSAGNGTYTMASVQSGTGADHYAGWSLVVAYRSGTQERNLRIYDGLQGVTSAPVDIPIGGLLTPATGTVRFTLGVVSYEGDLGTTGDTATLDSTPLTNGANPAGNVFNSTIADASGTLVTTKSPDYPNQMGYDSDAFSLDGVLGNNVTSTTMHLTTTGDVYLPGVITTSIDRANTPPSSGSAPTFSSTTPRDGDPVTVDPGSWSGTPTITYGYQWRRCDTSGSGCADIGGATAATYTPTSTDVGSTLRVAVTATNPIGTGTSTSAATSVVAPAPPVLVTTPAVTGTTRDGATLSVDDGAWSGTVPMTFTYQWRRCAAGGGGCVTIPGAVDATYDLTGADVGRSLRAVVTATNAAGSASATTAPTAAIDPLAPGSQAAPTITGTARDGSTLTGAAGTWTGTAPATYAYQWRRCAADGTACADVDQATGSTYALTSADVGHTLRLAVTATNAAGSATATSAPSPVVDPLAPANTIAPDVTGTTRDGSTLTADTGTWTGTPAITHAYQWRRCAADGTACTDIDQATTSTYALTGVDVGHALRVAVTATNAGGSATATSAATASVAPVAPANTIAPDVTGTARDGSTLAADTGTWTGTPTLSHAYQWRRCAADGTACADIDQATTSTYSLTGADAGHALRVAVTATNTAGGATATSAATRSVEALPPVVVTSARPTLAGEAATGGELRAEDGRWTGTPPFAVTYAWLRCDADGESCAPIPGATDRVYRPTADDVGARLRVRVTATNAAGAEHADSEASATVPAAPQDAPAPQPPVLVSPPAISGVRTPGHLLTATSGTWTSSEPLVYSYQWRRCAADGSACTDITGATDHTYVIAAEDSGSRIEVVVTARLASGGAEATAGTAALDLSELPGSLVAPAQCTQLTTAVVTRALRAGGGLGTFRLHVAAARRKSTAWTPAVAHVAGAVGRLRAVGLRLDGHPLLVRGAAAALPPALLAGRSVHRVTATLLPRRGRARRITLTLSSARCAAVFTATRRPGRTTRTLLLRIDSRSAVQSMVLHLPAATVRNLFRTRPGLRLGALRIVRGGNRRAAWRLRGPRGGLLLAAHNGPRVRLTGDGLRVSGLPSQTGIATVSLVRPAARRARTPALSLTGDATTAAAWRRMTFALPAGRGAG